MTNKQQKLAALFEETGVAHHQAFLETDGYDLEWPLWYADYLSSRLPQLLDVHLSRSELVYLVVHLSRVQATEAPDEAWPSFYARYVIDHYT